MLLLVEENYYVLFDVDLSEVWVIVPLSRRDLAVVFVPPNFVGLRLNVHKPLGTNHGVKGVVEPCAVGFFPKNSDDTHVPVYKLCVES